MNRHHHFRPVRWMSALLVCLCLVLVVVGDKRKTEGSAVNSRLVTAITTTTTTTAPIQTTTVPVTLPVPSVAIEKPIAEAAKATQKAVRAAEPIQVTPTLPPPEPAAPDAPPYVGFVDCKQAVDYLFEGRWDYERAVHVVYRESRYDPTAVSRTNALGCAQLTGKLKQPPFLTGPWNDPFWNVLALRRAVDAPGWGWCHWDVVNYCLPGGEW